MPSGIPFIAELKKDRQFDSEGMHHSSSHQLVQTVQDGLAIGKKQSDDLQHVHDEEMERFKQNLQEMINYSSGKSSSPQIVTQKNLDAELTSKQSPSPPMKPFLQANAKMRNTYLQRTVPSEQMDLVNQKRRENVGISADAMKDRIIAQHKHNTLTQSLNVWKVNPPLVSAAHVLSQRQRYLKNKGHRTSKETFCQTQVNSNANSIKNGGGGK